MSVVSWLDLLYTEVGLWCLSWVCSTQKWVCGVLVGSVLYSSGLVESWLGIKYTGRYVLSCLSLSCPEVGLLSLGWVSSKQVHDFDLI